MNINHIIATGILCASTTLAASAEEIIRVSTRQTDLVMKVAENGRLYQSYLGQHLNHETDLNAGQMYHVREINLMPGKSSWLDCHDKTYSGQYLMTVGIDVLTTHKLLSHVLEITAE